jgi:hypothetical protein
VQTRKGGEGELELASTELGTRASTERESERGRALSRIQFPSVSSLVFRSSSLRIIEIVVGRRFGAVSMLGLRKENQRVRVRSEEERDGGGGGDSTKAVGLSQETLAERESSAWLTSSLRWLSLYNSKYCLL